MDATVTSEERNQALYAHVSGILVLTGLPFAHVVGPLVFFLRARNGTSAFALENAREALNFQITASIVYVLAIAGYAVAFFSALSHARIGPATQPDEVLGVFGVAFLLLILAVAYAIFDLICVIVASIAASDGRTFRYPLSIRFVR